ncbi:MAG: hypothetical protein GX877_00840 [Bacteroidales bacterium]|nr:hypothetical protein [Bacteroidales bacterium]
MKKLFTIESVTATEPGNFRATARLNTTHEVFQGHFPEVPILPGVCSLYLIRICTETILGKKLQYVAVGTCKFSSVVEPLREETLLMNAKTEVQEETNEIKVSAELQYGTHPVLKMQALMKEVGI